MCLNFSVPIVITYFGYLYAVEFSRIFEMDYGRAIVIVRVTDSNFISVGSAGPQHSYTEYK